MKTLLTLLTALLLSSCAPTIRMHYSISLADHGTVLCRDYTIRGDTILLWDAGHFMNRKNQRNVTNCKGIGFNELLIVEIR